MRYEIQNNQKLLVAVLVIGIVSVALFTIFILILVWTPRENNNYGIDVTTENIKLGQLRSINITEEQVVRNYCIEIFNAFISEDLNLLNGLILSEYLEFRNISPNDVKNVLIQKNISGKLMEFVNYTVIKHPNYGKIFEINIQSQDRAVNEKMLVIEKSPNNYMISFDGFIGLDRTKRSVIIEGLKLDITEIKELLTVTSIKFTLTNVSGRDIIINKDNKYEVLFLELTSGMNVRLDSTWLSGDNRHLNNGHSINLNSEFVIGNINNGVATNLLITDVYDTISRELKTIKFPIY